MINIFGNNPFHPSHLKTREVKIGDFPLGNGHPVRIQSMTSVSTLDTENAVAQCIRMIHAGVDYIRFTAPNIREAKNLTAIKKKLLEKGYQMPLIADIHFNPGVAEIAAAIVDKVRINPGNFIPQRTYREKGIEAVREKLIPLLNICKEHGTALRIGVNHGSLSESKMEQYGDTPEGMVFSALEYLEVCVEEQFDQLVFSMKSSNTRVMIYAYRMLVQKMEERGQVYPLHLGVTEAGEGEDGRIKSAVGIGALLADGIGDTIRVSLTEEPEEEVPVAKKLAGYFEAFMTPKLSNRIQEYPVSLFEYKKRKTIAVDRMGGNNVPVVVANLSEKSALAPTDLLLIGYVFKNGSWIKKDQAADYLFLGNRIPDFQLPKDCGVILNYKTWNSVRENEKFFPLFPADVYLQTRHRSKKLNFILIDPGEEHFRKNYLPENDPTLVLVLNGRKNSLYVLRKWFTSLIETGSDFPVIIIWS